MIHSFDYFFLCNELCVLNRVYYCVSGNLREVTPAKKGCVFICILICCGKLVYGRVLTVKGDGVYQNLREKHLVRCALSARGDAPIGEGHSISS